MRNALLAAAVLLWAAVPALAQDQAATTNSLPSLNSAQSVVPTLAQNSMATTQNPPSSNSAQAAPQTDDSLPPAAETSNHDLPGSQLGRTSSLTR